MALQAMNIDTNHDLGKKTERLAPYPESKDSNENTFVTPANDGQELQYYLLYKSRLDKLRPILKQSVRQQWGTQYKLCPRVLDAQTSSHDKQVVIFGTLYKEMNKKRSVLEEYHDDAPTENKIDESEETVAGRYVSNDDYLMIEDEHGSLRIDGSCLNVNKLFTGIVVALRGKLNKSDGIFQATDCLFPNAPPLLPNCNNLILNNNNNSYNNNNNSNSSNSINSGGKDEYIAFISDLRFANIPDNNIKSHFDLQLMFDYLGGFLGSFESDQLNINSKISRLIIAGNVLGEDEMPTELDDMRYDRKYLKKIDLAREKLDNKLKDLDLWLSQMASNLNIDVMPGKIDPTNELLPQRPFHKCLFPLSMRFDTFKCVSNPYRWKLDKSDQTNNNNNSNNHNNAKNFTILGCSGENIDNMMEHGLLTDMECLELTLQARNIAPTAPDTLTCFPYRSNDPFLIENSPNIYFVGTRSYFDKKYVNNNQTLLLCVPSFVKTQQMVLVNKNTLECKLIHFGHQF